MLKGDNFSTNVSARVLEFFGDGNRIPWFRRLWNTGFSLTLAEVLEGSEAVRECSQQGWLQKTHPNHVETSFPGLRSAAS